MKHTIFLILFLLIASCATKESSVRNKTNKRTSVQNVSVLKEKTQVVNDSNLPAAWTADFIEKRLKNRSHKVERIERLSTAALEYVFKNKRIFQLYYNANLGVRGGYIYSQTFIEGIGDVESDIQASTIISRQKIPIENADQALLLVKAFADLKCYSIANESPISGDNRDYSCHTFTTDSTWIISIVLGYSSSTIGYNRYKLQIAKTGAISIISCVNIYDYVFME